MKDERKTKKQLIEELEELRGQQDSFAARLRPAVERVRAQAMAMRHSDDLRTVVAVMFEELQRLDIDVACPTIWFLNPEADRYTNYDSFRNPARSGVTWTSPDLVAYNDEIVTSVGPGGSYREWLKGDLGQGWQQGASWVEHLVAEEQHLWRRAETWGLSEIPPEWLQLYTEGVPRLHVPFEHGLFTLAVWKHQPEDMPVAEAFTQALSLGYVRFLDLVRLEEQNRNLEVERAVERVRAEASAMRESSDIGKVMAAMYDGWRDCGLVFSTGTINIVDTDKGRYHTYMLFPGNMVEAGTFGERLVVEDVVPGMNLYRSLELDIEFARQRSYALPDQGATLWTAPETFPEDLEALWGERQSNWDQTVGLSGITVPFAYGGIFAMAQEGVRFTEAEVEIVERFADAVSLGYTRHLDFRHLEEQNRNLEIEQALERVRTQVAGMEGSGDLQGIVRAVEDSLKGLGVGCEAVGINTVDRDTGLCNLGEQDSVNFGIDQATAEEITRLLVQVGLWRRWMNHWRNGETWSRLQTAPDHEEGAALLRERGFGALVDKALSDPARAPLGGRRLLRRWGGRHESGGH